MRIRSSVMVAVVAILTGSAQAAPILWVNDSEGNIGKVDVATGDVELVGNAGVVLTDIGFDPDGNLFGVSFDGFYSVSKATGAATLIGSLETGDSNALVFSSTGVAYVMGIAGDSLFTVDLTTGAASSVGEAGGFASAGDLAFHDGQLYLASTTNELIAVALDPPVGGTAVGPFGVQEVFGLANAGNDVLYAVAGTSVYTIDVATGGATFVLDYGGQGLGQAFGQGFITEAGAVPEPGAYLMLATGLLMSWPVVRGLRAA
jgi:hypothetical protein